ncbi:XRE family transcriptional regulator [Sulfitobacter sp. SK012]|nr:XRE family transcriptional regulator [Sulfitobacter sp. SK012]
MDKSHVLELRKNLGSILQGRRKALGKTQAALAHEIGVEFYTFISQVEGGKARVPPDRIIAYARALKMAPAELAELIIKHYDPLTYEALRMKK